MLIYNFVLFCYNKYNKYLFGGKFMANGYGISQWQDAKEIYKELADLTSKPIYCVSDEALQQILDHFDTNCAKSKEITTEAKKYIPGGVQHNLAFNYPFPMCMEKAEGAYLYDRDGNQYIDFLQAGGPTILGSNYPAVKEKVFELLNNCGPVTGLFHEGELLLAKKINELMPACEMFRMLGIGHGGYPRRALRHKEKARHQNRRCVSRLVRPNGVRPQNPRQPSIPRIARHPWQLRQNGRSAPQRPQNA